jgi:ketosteroid isomerase-like protein
MSEENVEAVRRAVEAYGGGNPEPFFEMFDSGIEWHGTPEAVVGSAAHGIAGVRDYLAQWQELWDEHSLEPIEVIDAGQAVVVVMHERGRGHSSGVEVDRTIAGVYSFGGSKIVRAEHYTSKEEALRAAGSK